MAESLRNELFTIGHSNRDLEAFVELLCQHHIAEIVDVRRFPGSRRQPCYARAALARELSAVGIRYLHMSALGGRRAGRDASPTMGDAWRSASFRGYAQHTQTACYVFALRDLLFEARDRRVAIMCSEAVPWRCHRWLIADTVVARGWRVLHIIGEHSMREHLLTSFAAVDGDCVTWPGPPSTDALRLGPAALDQE